MNLRCFVIAVFVWLAPGKPLYIHCFACLKKRRRRGEAVKICASTLLAKIRRYTHSFYSCMHIWLVACMRTCMYMQVQMEVWLLSFFTVLSHGKAAIRLFYNITTAIYSCISRYMVIPWCANACMGVEENICDKGEGK